MDEVEAITTQQEPAVSASAPGSSTVSSGAEKSVCRRLFDPNDCGNKSELSVRVDTFADLVTVPRSVLDGIWEKAFELATDPNAIAPAPGYDKGQTVNSSSGKRPHLAMAKNKGQYCCDSDCGNHKSLGICSHSVAVAETDGELKGFDWFVKAKKRPNITNLVLTGMPIGRGRKGGIPLRKKSVAATSRTPASSFLINSSTSSSISTSITASTSTTNTIASTGSIATSVVSTSIHPYSSAPLGGSSSTSMIAGTLFHDNLVFPHVHPHLCIILHLPPNQTVFLNCAL